MKGKQMRLAAATVVFVLAVGLTACSNSSGLPPAGSLGPSNGASTLVKSASGSFELYDNFTEDSGLNSSLWTDSSSYLTQVLANHDNPPATVITPTLAFSHSKGMAMSGITTSYEQTGITSNASFAPPFTAKVVTKLTSSTDGGLGLSIMNGGANAGAWINVGYGSGRYNGVWYAGAGPSYQGSGADPWQYLGSLASSPQSARYTLRIHVNAAGKATVCASVGGGSLGCSASIDSGAGPYYLILSIGTGYLSGQPTANWYHAEVSS
jgi:hypothetical protein